MSNDDEQSDHDRIHRMDTVPPPNGEEDPYSAATKVGPMANAVVEEMMHAAQRKASELAQRSADKTTKSAPHSVSEVAAGREARPATRAPVGPSAPIAPQKPAFPPAAPKVKQAAEPEARAGAPATDENMLASDGASVPRAYDEDDDEDNAATMLSLKAKPPVITQGAAAPPPEVVRQPEPEPPRPPNPIGVDAAVRAPIPYDAPSTREYRAVERWLLLALAAGLVLFVAGAVVFFVVGR